jgi:hypothetical protein
MRITHRIPWALPYGYTEVEYESDESPNLLKVAREAIEMEAAVANHGRALTPPEDDPSDPGPQEPHVVVTPSGEARVEGTGERVTGEVFLCPDCGREAKPSIERYQEWEVGEDGREYAQKWFCPNNACPTKSLWRSKLRRPEAARR